MLKCLRMGKQKVGFTIDPYHGFVFCFVVFVGVVSNTDLTMTVFEFSNNIRIDLEDYPPAPVTWLTATVDTVCSLLPCNDWRESFGVQDDPWLSMRVPSLKEARPELLSYSQFCHDTGLPQTSASSLYQYAFETPSTTLGDLGNQSALLATLAVLIVLRLVKSVLLPLFSSYGRKAGRLTHGVQWEKDNEERIQKFGEYVYRLLFHSVISIFGILYFRDTEWWRREGFNFVGTKSLFENYPEQSIAPSLAWYYIVQAAYNADAMISLLEISFDVQFQNPFAKSKSKFQSPVAFRWSKNVRGDFSEMFVHHIVTNALCFGSSICRLNRTGSMVFLLHDVSDVPVDLSKLANFLKWKVTTVVFFATMTLTWMVTRLYLLPFVIFSAALRYSHYTMQTGMDPMLWVCYRHFFYVMLSVLILLHLSWFTMFIRMFLTLVTKNECHDYSEHKNGEQSHLNASTTNGSSVGVKNGKKKTS